MFRSEGEGKESGKREGTRERKRGRCKKGEKTVEEKERK